MCSEETTVQLFVFLFQYFSGGTQGRVTCVSLFLCQSVSILLVVRLFIVEFHLLGFSMQVVLIPTIRFSFIYGDFTTDHK